MIYWFNFLNKSKYSFFNILSYAYSRAEAKLLLNRLSRRGQDISQDSYLEIFNALILNFDIRSEKQIPMLFKFGGQQASSFKFDDDIALGVYLDFKRVSNENLKRLVQGIQECRLIKHLTLGGSPNPYFTDIFFESLGSNESITRLDFNIEWIPTTSYNALQVSLAENKHLRDMHFSGFDMTNTNMEQIVQGLGMNQLKRLRSLSFHDVHMQPQCLKVLCSYLQHVNPMMFEELTLSNLNFTYSTGDVAEMLRENTNLKSFKVIQCQNFLTGADLIGKALSNHSNLQELQISSVGVTAEFFGHIANVIKQTKIQKLTLEGLGNRSNSNLYS